MYNVFPKQSFVNNKKLKIVKSRRVSPSWDAVVLL